MPSSQPIQSVMRALDLLELLTREIDGLTLDELAVRSGLNKTTAHNLLRTLRNRGYVQQAANRRFFMGGGVHDLWMGRERSACFRRAEAEVRRLHRMFPEATVIFCERTGSEISCRLRMSADAPGLLGRPRAQIMSPYTSATGLCFQAFSPDYREVMALLHPLEEERQRIWKSPKAFREALEETVRRGVAVIRVDRFVRMAAPVSDILSIGLQQENPGCCEERGAKALTHAAQKISGPSAPQAATIRNSTRKDEPSHADQH